MNKKQQDFADVLKSGKGYHPLDKKIPPKELILILEDYREHRKKFDIGSRKRVGIALFSKKLKDIFPEHVFGRTAIENWIKKRNEEEGIPNEVK